MDAVIELLIQYGYWGMFIAAFIAGSVFPFSSEAVMAGLQLAGLNPMSLLIWGTLGNVAGSMFCEKREGGKDSGLDGETRCLDGCALLSANSG